MVSKKEVLGQIYEDWGQKPQSNICAEILDYLLRIDTNRALHITYGSLRKVINGNYGDSELLTAVQYLCGERTHLLEAKFELIDNNDYIDIPNSDLNHARATGQLIHPESGELISNFEEKVYIYFQPSPLVKNIH
ncbi:MAG: hypothetical protein HC878_20055 [Leptolyngbyaceae cyanobacterium SL_5_14]|nr:hypothetical protein [Leptolyngbyaceae cyanobacterium SL_5_14]